MKRWAVLLTVGLASGGRLAAAGSGGGKVSVTSGPGGPIVIATAAAEFRLLPSGELQGALLDGGRRLSLQEAGSGDAAQTAGATAEALGLDLTGASVTDVQGSLGAGKRVSVRGRTRVRSAPASRCTRPSSGPRRRSTATTSSSRV